MNGKQPEKSPKILVFSTEKISDPAIDLAGLLKMHYHPGVYTIIVPCSSAVKPRWIMASFEKGFDGVFIAADGTDCPTGKAVLTIQQNYFINTRVDEEKGIDPAKLKMAAICSVCAEAFVKHMNTFAEYLSKS